MHQGSTELPSPREQRLKNLCPPWPKGVSGNPAGKQSRKKRHSEMVAKLVADLGRNIGPIDRTLLEQAAWLLIQGEDLQRARNKGKPVSDEDMTRCANGAARILLKLRGNCARANPAFVPLRERLAAEAEPAE